MTVNCDERLVRELAGAADDADVKENRKTVRTGDRIQIPSWDMVV
jgi:hypothetical protein